LKRYPVPWDLVLRLAPCVWSGEPARLDRICAEIVRRLEPPPTVLGLEKLPADPRFVLVANHYQRRGLWIVHPAAVLTEAIRNRYALDNPPVRWVVTANWLRIRIGPWSFPSPGDWLLPRVARILSAYPVPFAGSNPALAARSLRRLIREAKAADRPVGLFPEGVAGQAGKLGPPLPGTGRLLAHLARTGMPAVPAAIGENEGLIVRFGDPIPAAELAAAAGAASLVIERLGTMGRGAV
jgi:1-acyl-sn-glycerol-3-phosphate acyltransferase